MSTFKDLLSGYDVLRFFGRDVRFQVGISDASKVAEKSCYELNVTQSKIFNGLGILNMCFQGVVMALMGWLSIEGVIIQSALLGGNTICGNVYNGLEAIVDLQLSIASSKPYFDKITVHAGESLLMNNSLSALQKSITLEDISFWYDEKKPILVHMNAQFKKGGKYALIGPSGCGKSTLLKSLNRMNDLVEGCVITGKVQLDGEDIYGDMDVNLLRKRVGMVFQKPNPFPMSIYDNIAYGPRTHGIRSKSKLDDIVEKSLRDAAIWDEVKDRLKKSALGMSGGQQQRLCIARALAVQPEVLLMDEPTSALDPISTSKIEELAMELKKDYTIVMVTHNMQQATRISDKTAFFLLGEVVEFDDTDKLFSMPSDKRTEDYITGRFG